jgi:hypothetical protein
MPRSFNGFERSQLRLEFESLARMKAKLVQTHVNLTDAEFECIHGALPLDRSKPVGCLCWPRDAMVALANRQQDNPDYSDAA